MRGASDLEQVIELVGRSPSCYPPGAASPKTSRSRTRVLRGESLDQRSELVEKPLQKFPRALVADIAVVVNEVGFEGYVGFAALQGHAKSDHDRAQMLLRQRT